MAFDGLSQGSHPKSALFVFFLFSVVGNVSRAFSPVVDDSTLFFVSVSFFPCLDSKCPLVFACPPAEGLLLLACYLFLNGGKRETYDQQKTCWTRGRGIFPLA